MMRLLIWSMHVLQNCVMCGVRLDMWSSPGFIAMQTLSWGVNSVKIFSMARLHIRIKSRGIYRCTCDFRHYRHQRVAEHRDLPASSAFFVIPLPYCGAIFVTKLTWRTFLFRCHNTRDIILRSRLQWDAPNRLIICHLRVVMIIIQEA